MAFNLIYSWVECRSIRDTLGVLHLELSLSTEISYIKLDIIIIIGSGVISWRRHIMLSLRWFLSKKNHHLFKWWRCCIFDKTLAVEVLFEVIDSLVVAPLAVVVVVSHDEPEPVFAFHRTNTVEIFNHGHWRWLFTNSIIEHCQHKLKATNTHHTMALFVSGFKSN